jgi:hypothetical protein
MHVFQLLGRFRAPPSECACVVIVYPLLILLTARILACLACLAFMTFNAFSREGPTRRFCTLAKEVEGFGKELSCGICDARRSFGCVRLCVRHESVYYCVCLCVFKCVCACVFLCVRVYVCACIYVQAAMLDAPAMPDVLSARRWWSSPLSRRWTFCGHKP